MNNKIEKEYTLIKLWNSILKKCKRINNKLSSKYENENIEQLSDDESDKTKYEIYNKHKLRGRKANSSKSHEKNSNYDKRDNSLDIKRNENNEYEIVLPYQKLSRK